MASTRSEKQAAFRSWVDAAVECQRAAAALMDLVEGSDEHTTATAALDQACAAARDAHEEWRRIAGASG